MATMNPFDLLGEDDNDDPSQLIIAAQQAAPKKALAPTQPAPAQKQSPAPGKLPSKPLPPAQAVREAKSETGSGRGGSRSGGRGVGRGRGGGFNRDYGSNETSFNNGVSGGYGGVEEGESGKTSDKGHGSYGGPRGSFRGGRRGGFSNGEVEGDRNRRQFERRSGTGRGNGIKREGSGRGNWGTGSDEIVQEPEEFTNALEKNASPEVQPGEEDAAVVNKENPVNEPEEKEPEEKEMTLDQYEKVLEEKRKALQALKLEERKVDLDKEFQSMQQLSGKKSNNDIFIKLGSEKDKRKDSAEKEEKAKKSLSINEFLKPAEGGRYYGAGGRGRGRGGRGSRGAYAEGNINNVAAPSIEDPGQFPTLGAR
ncbi:RGG repeats nuclear RNA binding protein A [Cinnamomum micranthum f. kanehirae]|uniref:RGG repeats nuclear RNA binding protein A n=1 Tax=Cinnamomum micranthum f. kanehirae TaxID=337451 RepID=A0A3S4NRG1_9MAGN|nr:RGG repeats nuclear RNA binding protein A [Cinnamomum micranthum f. kanehirae]